uniref:Uncharacterized protein n=1 Tax=Avena sativa TaxID=4498 RepID=A0ACD5XBI3_AVESA
MLDMALLFGVVFASILARAASVGVCYGMSANNLPPPSTVVGMLQDNGFNSVRLYAPDGDALAALGGTGIGVIVGAPNYVLPDLATSASAAAAWIRANIEAHPSVSFRYLSVGNEVAGSDTQYLVPAMENVYGALAAAGLGHISVTTAISQVTIAVHLPPSAGEFADGDRPFLLPVLQFLERTGAPLLANLYPYFVYTYNPGLMELSFPLFTAPGVVVQDGEYGYQNMFDASVDAVHAAVDRLLGSSGSVGVVVSETGWPSAGGEAASVENARTYNQNLASHVVKGTPRRPWKVETYLFSMFNENLKDAGVEQNWGLFYPSTDRVYPITFGSK